MDNGFEKDLKNSYRELVDTSILPPSNAFSRIMETIKQEEKAQHHRTGESIFSKLFEFIRDIINIQKMGWAVAGVQFAVIIFLVLPPSVLNVDTFHTLSTNKISINKISGKAMEVNIVFKENALQKEIWQLLNKSDAVIINGPTETGLYVLHIKQGDDLDARLQAIKDSKIVKFLDKRY